MKSSSALCKTFCLHFLHSGDAVHSCSIKQRLAVSDSQVYVFYISTLYNVFSSEISVSICKSNTQLKLSIKFMYISLFLHVCAHHTRTHPWSSCSSPLLNDSNSFPVLYKSSHAHLPQCKAESSIVHN